MKKITIGTRKSALALWQTEHVVGLLNATSPALQVDIKPFSTRGDEILDKALPQIGGKGVFTEALEDALRAGEIDYAVHSLKDVPTEDSASLIIGAITAREAPHDVLISKGGQQLDHLPQGATIGTSSTRRSAQLLAYRPDLTVRDIRGNVNTRLDKLFAPDSPYDALILAQAGIIRLGMTQHITQVLPLTIMLPAPGQGALAVQCRADEVSVALLKPIADATTTICVTAERAFLSALGGGCSLPVGAYAEVRDGVLHLRGRVGAVANRNSITVEAQTTATLADGIALAHALAQQAIAQGARDFLI